MSTFSTYNTLIEQKIANSSEIFYDSEMKMQAANDVISDILDEYDIPEFIKRSTITFDANGLAAIPSDYTRMIKLWETNANGQQLYEYIYLPPDEFDMLASTAAYYWTEDYIVADSERKLKCLPVASGTLDIRYMSPPTAMTTDSTDSGLSSKWDEAVAYGTAMRLFQNANRYDEAREYERLYRDRVTSTYLFVKNPGGWKQNNRLRSKYERISLLGNNSIDING